MELREMSIEELEARYAELKESIDSPEIDSMEKVEELRSNLEAVKEELENRKAIAAEKAEIRARVAEGEGEVKETIPTEERKLPTMEEIRNSKEYIDAYAEYIKTGKDEECRALLSENATGGTIPVPEMVYDIVKTAWDREGITRRIRKAYINGNLKVGFEISSSDAVDHPEGHEESEESLALGTVELVPATIMKWVSVSKEARKLRGESFIRYIYDELTYRIAKKAADNMIAAIEACGTVSTTTCPSVPKIVATTVSLALVANAFAQLSDEADNPTVMMNKLTFAKFKEAQVAGNFAVDPFEGFDVEFNNKIKSFDAASTGDTWMILGDLDKGALMLLPEDSDIEVTEDALTLATSGLIRYIGDMMVAEKVVADKAFCKVVK